MTQLPATALAPYDVVLLGSFGGPERTRRGAAVPAPTSPRAAASRTSGSRRSASTTSAAAAAARSTTTTAPCSRALRAELDRREHRRPGLLGQPQLRAVLRRGAPARRSTVGAARLVTLLTSAYSSYSSCRQYREDLAAAVAEVGPAADGLVVDKVRPYAVHPGFARAWRRALVEALRRAAATRRRRPPALRHPLHPRGDGRHVRPGRRRGQPLHRPARRARRRLTDEVNAEPGLDLERRARLLLPLGPAEPAMARARRQRPHRGAGAEDGAPVVVVPDRVRLRPHGGRPRPRHRGRRDGRAARACRSCGWRPPGTDDRFVEGLVDLLLERAARGPRRGRRPETWLPGDVRPSVCAPGCCPNLRAATARPCAGATDGHGIRRCPAASTPPSSSTSPAGSRARPAGLIVDERPADLAVADQVDRRPTRSP